MRIIYFAFISIVLLSACTDKNEYKMIWSDEFEYQGLPNASLWKYDTEGNEHGWGNNELQYFTIDSLKNAHVSEGTLKITAVNEKIGKKDFTSARLNSVAAWKHGRIEVRAKLPVGRGTWPAIWMMPENWTFNMGNWPDVGEIDIMEHVGYEPGVIHASAHSKDYQWQNGSQKTGVIYIANATTEFNNYIMEWDENVMKTFVNDSLFFEYKNEGLGADKWPYNKPFYLILNVSVGGAWGAVQGIDTSAFPQVMEIDYVRIYQKNTK